MRRRRSPGRPCGRNSKSFPGMKTSEDEESGGGAVTVTGGRGRGSSRKVGGGASCLTGGGDSCWSAGVSGAGGGVCWPNTTADVNTQASRISLATTRGPTAEQRMNTGAKVIPHDAGLIQYIPDP